MREVVGLWSMKVLVTHHWAGWPWKKLWSYLLHVQGLKGEIFSCNSYLCPELGHQYTDLAFQEACGAAKQKSRKLKSDEILHTFLFPQPFSEGFEPSDGLGVPMCSCPSPQPVCSWVTQRVSKRTCYNSAVIGQIKSVLGLSGTLLGCSAGGGFSIISSGTCPLLKGFGLFLSLFDPRMMPSYRISMGLTVGEKIGHWLASTL